MPDAEFAHQLSALAETAKQLNAASDSVTQSITTFQARLRSMNVGLEVWVTLDSQPWNEEGESGTMDTELGFTKYGSGGDWLLATRRAQYKDDRYRTFNGATPLMPLLQETRDRRIEALGLFPTLAKAMHEEAKAKLKKVTDAEAFLK